VEEVLCLIADRKQRKRQERDRDRIPLKTYPSDLLPPTRSHLLKFPELPKIAPPAEIKHSTHEPGGWGRTFHIQTMTQWLCVLLTLDFSLLSPLPAMFSYALDFSLLSPLPAHVQLCLPDLQ
jgi:hypothetical protein